MSAYCPDCRFDPKQRTGQDACPLSALYRDFIGRHRDRWEWNRRMRNAVRQWDRSAPRSRRRSSGRARRAGRELAG